MSAYQDVILAESGLVYYMTCGEPAGTTATDLAPTPYNGTYSATGITYGQSGIPGDPATSVLLDGASTTFCTINTTVPAKFQVNDLWSMECWIRRTALSGAGTPDIWSEANTNGSLVRFSTADRIVVRKFGVADAMTSTVPVTADSLWHHIVVTKNAGTLVMWIDGVDVSGTYTPQTMVSPANTLVRRVIGGTDTAMTGYAAHFALYNIALSSTQVAAHRALGFGAQAGMLRRFPLGV